MAQNKDAIPFYWLVQPQKTHLHTRKPYSMTRYCLLGLMIGWTGITLPAFIGWYIWSFIR